MPQVPTDPHAGNGIGRVDERKAGHTVLPNLNFGVPTSKSIVQSGGTLKSTRHPWACVFHQERHTDQNERKGEANLQKGAFSV